MTEVVSQANVFLVGKLWIQAKNTVDTIESARVLKTSLSNFESVTTQSVMVCFTVKERKTAAKIGEEKR